MASCKYLISIIIPTYNREEFLKESIESALNQTYPYVEVVVVDDGSVDTTQEILRRYDGRIKAYTQKRNMGVSAALNVGIKGATGQWLKFHGSDDVLDSDAVEHILSFANSIDEQNRNNSIILNNLRIMSENGFVENATTVSSFNSFESRQKILAILAGLVPIGSFSGHRDVFIKNKFDETLSNYEDMELILRCAINDVNVWDLDKHTGSMRKHAQQISRQLSRKNSNKLRAMIIRTTLAQLPFRDQIWYNINMMKGDVCGIKIRKWQQVYNTLQYIFPTSISVYLAESYLDVASRINRRFLHKKS